MLISEVYERYDEYLKENNAMDFDDLLMKCYELLSEHEDVREYYANKFRYIHVDEFQDTNAIQFDILKLLASKWKNVFVVGDDDQSIYGWRGADIRNILDFGKSFPDAKVYKLEQNYRSTQEILDCANRLIKNNASRSDKSLFTDSGKGTPVEYNLYSSDYEEVDSVISKITTLKRSMGYKNKDFAILVRNNSLTRLFEKNLTKTGIKYRVYGGFKFYDRKEILDVLAYLRILVNPRDNEAVMRVINFPKRGIGDTTVEQIASFAEQSGESMIDVIDRIEDTDLGSAVKAKVGVFRDLISDLRFHQNKMSLADFCEYLVKKVGFEQFYCASEKLEDEDRWGNIEQFLIEVQEREEEELTLVEFLHSVQLNTELDKNDDDADTVTVSTMHAVKGLEFPVVFVVACEEGIIPSSQSLKETNGVDEERRVMYVALTRAQKLLFISAVKGFRVKFARNEAALPSRFMNEAHGTPLVPPKQNPWQRHDYESRSYRKWDEEKNSNIPTYSYQPQQKSSFFQNYKPQIQVASKIASAPSKQSVDTSAFHAGVKVKHKKFGEGTVLIVEGSGSSAAVTVAFKGLGIKKFSLAVAPLEII